MLLERYPGVTSARGFAARGDGRIWIRFRCGDLSSLAAITSCAVAANVVLRVGDPEGRLGYEPEGLTDLPFDLLIDDGSDFDGAITYPQIFGAFLAWDLGRCGRVDRAMADRLLAGWSAALLKDGARPNPPLLRPGQSGKLNSGPDRGR